MKKVKCPICNGEKTVEDNIIMAICPACQVEMLPLNKYERLKLPKKQNINII